MFLKSILLFIIIFIAICYSVGFFFFSGKIKKVEQRIIGIFLAKIGKIPALIEVMRPFVADQKVFDTITQFHSQSMLYAYDSIYAVLELNAQMHTNFLFLMKLSVQIPELQQNEQFVYIRDFIMRYERTMKKDLSQYNGVAGQWNSFIFAKNITLLGLLFPGKQRMYI